MWLQLESRDRIWRCSTVQRTHIVQSGFCITLYTVMCCKLCIYWWYCSYNVFLIPTLCLVGCFWMFLVLFWGVVSSKNGHPLIVPVAGLVVKPMWTPSRTPSFKRFKRGFRVLGFCLGTSPRASLTGTYCEAGVCVLIPNCPMSPKNGQLFQENQKSTAIYSILCLFSWTKTYPGGLQEHKTLASPARTGQI